MKSKSAVSNVAEPGIEVVESEPNTDTVDTISPCSEAKPPPPIDEGVDPFDFVGYSQANAALTIYCNRLPPPTKFGHGNPFLMFLCLASLLQHRDHIMDNQLDYQERHSTTILKVFCMRNCARIVPLVPLAKFIYL